MKAVSTEVLDELVKQVLATKKYADVSPDLVRLIASHELARRNNLKDADKATRSKLHQVGSAYQEAAIPYEKMRSQLDQLPPRLTDPTTKDVLKQFLTYHASTRERLPILERIFTETLAPIAPIRSIVDIACGLNPLAIPWMPLDESCKYLAFDIYGEMIDFVNLFFKKFRIDGHASVRDVLNELPDEPVQLALILKTIPCLEQIDKSAGLRLMENVRAENLLVSFPGRSLGGRSKGMVQNYEAHFNELTAGKDWRILRFEFPGELAFLVQK